MPRVEIILLLIVVLLTVVLLFFSFERRNKNDRVSSQTQALPLPRQNIQPQAVPPVVPQTPSSISQPQDYPRLQNYNQPQGYSRLQEYSHPPLDYPRPPYRPYGLNAPGPYPGSIQNIPVPAGALKATNGLYNFTPDYGYMVPNGGVLPHQHTPLLSDGFFRPYGPSLSPSAFVGSVDAFLPFPEVNTPWEKAGILTSQRSETGTKELLNLYQRPIAPMQELWEYQVQDKDGFVIKLDIKRYIEDGDIIHHIIGKPGSWKANIFVQNKYVWV